MCRATPQMKWIVARIEDKLPSAVFSGILPDKRHLRQGGFHCCINHLVANGRAGDYSNNGPVNGTAAVTTAGRGYSAAFDVSMSKADMMRVHANVRRVWLDRSDPRRKYINAINCWDGAGDAVRYNFQKNTATRATPDHKWHAHDDEPRMYVDPHRNEAECWKAARAHVSVITGESRASWTAREETPPPAKPQQPQSPRPPVGAAPSVHRVAAGDTLWSMGQRYRIDVAVLKRYNRLTSDDIFPGQTLRLTAPPAPAKPKPAPGRPAAKPKPVVPVWPLSERDFFRPAAARPKDRTGTVAKWQDRMRSLGWDIVSDGYLGPKSGKVLVAFQRQEQLKVTGVLDKATFQRAWTTVRRQK